MSRTWCIYARDEHDKWIEEPISSTLSHEDDIPFHMGRFKHYVFRQGLNDLPNNKIYLYKGFRMAKSCMYDNKLVVTLCSKDAVDAWSSCKRSKLGLKFDKLWTQESSSYPYMLTFPYVITFLRDSQSAED